jgi:Arc/MetJ family transcription regulator
MRTNIVLNEELIREAQKYSQARTKRGLVEEALRTFVEVREAEKRRERYAERLQELRRKTAGIQLRTRPTELLDTDRRR